MNLSRDSETAVFDVLVTRFKQLPYYFQDRANFAQKTQLSSIGEAMLFRKVLHNFKDGELSYFDKMRDSQSFIEKLIQLREEMKISNLVAEDLVNGKLAESEKNRDLKKIICRFEAELEDKFLSIDVYSLFIDEVVEGKYKSLIENSIFVIAGFTRFSAQEKLLINALSDRVVIGTYANARSYKQHNNVIGVYSEAVKTIDSFSIDMIEERETKNIDKVYDDLTTIWEKENDFLLENELSDVPFGTEKVEIWEAENVTAEVEMVAKEIRQKIVLENKHYKDFTVLVGNVEKYELPIKQIFQLYEIPFFYSQQELMRNHPLIVFIESIQSIKRNNYQAVDVVNLLKTQLYSTVKSDLQYLDNFEYYLKKFKIRGKIKFSNVFNSMNYPENPSNYKKHYFDKAEKIENIRKELISKNSPLGEFLGTKKTSVENLLSKFLKFLKYGNIPENFQHLYNESKDETLKDKHQQVWKLFQKTLSEFQEVFLGEKLTVDEFLDVLVSGVKTAAFRQVPGTVDSVRVRDYELVQPRENEFVYAVGLTNGNFPHVKRNTSLLSDSDRALINENGQDKKFIEELETSSISKSNFAILSLLNSAKQKLTLSSPQIFNNLQENENPPLIQLLKSYKVPVKKVYTAKLNEGIKHIGNIESTMRSVLSMDLEDVNENNQENFWVKIKNYLIEKDPYFARLTKLDNNDIKSSGLSRKVSNQMYSKLTPSASSFEEFYNCEYKYFLDKTLGLKELEEVTLESSTIGNYFHRIFQILLQDGSSEVLDSEKFDKKLREAQCKVDLEYQKLFERDFLSMFTKLNLSEILEQSKIMIQKSIQVFEIEKNQTEVEFSKIRGINIKGKIDRVDHFENLIGATDYKSGRHDFNLTEVFNKTSLQLLTYLAALSKDSSVWGALYLHLQNPTLILSELSSLTDVNQKLLEQMKYKGLINSSAIDDTNKIASFVQLKNETWNSSGNQFSADDIGALIDFAVHQYSEGISRLQSSQIAVNPIYTDADDQYNVTGCRFCPFKSICKFEATRHIGRKINTFSDGSSVKAKDWKKVLEEMKARKD
ncbi:ATP-dependent helicase/nuclease subunit B [Lactovum miscens]|uniref:ATP-dependent helicase/nuclease subunit B n=2 Tax=Lactovum miscens TaxID=190387 RepID=A0A841C7G6_9LACT|nr:PD-(D/E)XK nuclease family protein [Lactovum miscens]MBB5887339.1 ATP-dependent helicase/nuclease subunit B [Lactovum miscens]